MGKNSFIVWYAARPTLQLTTSVYMFALTRVKNHINAAFAHKRLQPEGVEIYTKNVMKEQEHITASNVV